MPEPRALDAGTLLINGPSIQYQRPPSLSYEIAPGERVVFQLHYRYHEDSTDREDCIVRFRVNLEGGIVPTDQTEIKDTPVLQDNVQGVLEQAFTPPNPGHATATFEIEAWYERRSWLGAKRSKAYTFAHKEPCRILVLPPGAKTATTAAAKRKN